MKQQIHAARSAAWVSCLAEELRSFYGGTNATVFTKYDERNRHRFGLNELLHDISICEISTMKSPGQGQEMHYITRALWQIESELAEGDSTEWVKDFNKLVIGGAENKLFIGPVMRKQSRDSLVPIAKCCSGTVYFATIPHPSKWLSADLEVGLWKLSESQWIPC
jgi:hypothetical protein